ncbi:MAG: hypothetical protein II220_08505, partial [Spirochaetales bacterium]|nr:hypothetical protein [Spirochaetales bacterium]
MKHSIKTKILCFLISVLLVMQIVPFSTFAVNEINNGSSSTTFIDEADENNIGILYELEEKRDEYSKTFKLEDGSFLELTSFNPIHTLVDDEWEDTNIANTENIETVEDAVQLFNLENVATTTSSARSISDFYASESTAKMKAFSWDGNNYVATNSLKILNEDSAIVAKPNELGASPGKTRVVVTAQVILNCEKGDPAENGDEDIEHNYVAVYEAITPWTEETTIYDIDSYYGDIVYDSLNI